MNTHPQIIDPHRPTLPIMNTFEDAQRLDAAAGSDFHAAAFFFQGWIGNLLEFGTAQIAEIPDPQDRSFQNGQAWRSFQKFFPHEDRLPHLFGHLMSFASHDDSLALFLFRALAPLGTEHDITGEFIGKHALSPLRASPEQVLTLVRSTIIRLCDWLDSYLHYWNLRHWHLLPQCFDPDPQKRQWAFLAVNRRHFDSMDQKSQAHYLNHMSDQIDDVRESKKWAEFVAASKNPAPQPDSLPWPNELLDASIIKLWPLVKRHGWSSPELLATLRELRPPSVLQPCSDPATLADYCSHVLGLRRDGLRSNRNRGKNLPGLKVALHLLEP